MSYISVHVITQYSSLLHAFVHRCSTGKLLHPMVTLLVREHNKRNYGSRKIHSVLCPGLGTDIGLMDHDQCANQVRTFTSL